MYLTYISACSTCEHGIIDANYRDIIVELSATTRLLQCGFAELEVLSMRRATVLVKECIVRCIHISKPRTVHVGQHVLVCQPSVTGHIR